MMVFMVSVEVGTSGSEFLESNSSAVFRETIRMSAGGWVLEDNYCFCDEGRNYDGAGEVFDCRTCVLCCFEIFGV